MANRHAIGIDVGATNFRLGVVSDGGIIEDRHMSEVGRARSPHHIVDLLAKCIEAMRKNAPDIAGVGVGLPGIVDGQSGVVYASPHYPDWRDVGFKKLFEGAFLLPVALDNDANMVAAGEGWLGAGKELENFIMVTFGTGIGGGIVCNRQVWHGDNGFAGEIGHILVDFNGPRCECGSRGCWEMYSSAVGIRHLVADSSNDSNKERFLKCVDGDCDRVTPELLYKMAKEGDIFASIIWKKFGVYLGAGVASLANAFGIMNYVLGGGICRAWEFFINEAKAEIKRRTYKKTAGLIKLHRAKLGDDAGVYGSARTLLSKIVNVAS